MKLNFNCTAKEFAEYLEGISQKTPISDKYGDRKTLQKDYNAKTPYEAQRNHVIYWFKNEANAEKTAQEVFNKLKDAAMILWISETANVRYDIIEKAANEAGGEYMNEDFGKAKGKSGSSLSNYQAKIIKTSLTWELICSTINAI